MFGRPPMPEDNKRASKDVRQDMVTFVAIILCLELGIGLAKQLGMQNVCL